MLVKNNLTLHAWQLKNIEFSMKLIQANYEGNNLASEGFNFFNLILIKKDDNKSIDMYEHSFQIALV